jgi:hypothetical protein
VRLFVPDRALILSVKCDAFDRVAKRAERIDDEIPRDPVDDVLQDNRILGPTVAYLENPDAAIVAIDS